MDETIHELFMQRCLQLAELASGDVAPNPMVGAVLVHEGVIIGEGYHREYGKGHAEVNCLASVKSEQQHLIPQSTLYVSLEPCAHFGKTPPCADLIIDKKIPRVVIGCRDPFPEVNGKGLEKLKAAGVEITLGVLEKECRVLNKRFFLFHTEHRPYITLKWAQTADGKIAGRPLIPSKGGGTVSTQTSLAQDENEKSALPQSGGSPEAGGGVSQTESRLLISNKYTARLVHKWRSEEMAIAVGTNTALFDDPELSTRHWPGKNGVRVVVDLHRRLPASLKLFNGDIPTIVFNLHQHTLPFEKISVAQLREIGVGYYQITQDVSLVHQMLNGLYRLGIHSLLVEGGTQLLQSFIDEGLWDEARIINNEQLAIGNGLPAPQLKNGQLLHTETLFSDTIRTYRRVGGQTPGD
jgi:diaminohydroxyphosphoribosylaminopyrimidine deaminase / 5-amino-6-(5-phosphoribosylamino)uracil reductase